MLLPFIVLTLGVLVGTEGYVSGQSAHMVDLADVVVVGNEEDASDVETVVCGLVAYLGSGCVYRSVEQRQLTSDDLKDENGAYFALVVVDAARLSTLGSDALRLLSDAAASGVSLLVSKVDTTTSVDALIALTDGAVLAINEPLDSFQNWTVTTNHPAVTREFTGHTIRDDTENLPRAATLVVSADVIQTAPVVTATDDSGGTHVVFAAIEHGAGTIFIDAGEAIPQLPLRELYYTPERFSQLMPVLFSMKYALGDEGWHAPQDFVNLTLDDPTLTEPFQQLSFTDLLAEMNAHDFHTTIAFIPCCAPNAQPEVISLVLQNPDRYSLVQHGNNHDGYEFYHYQLSEGVVSDPDHHARPFDDQVRDIVEGLTRIARLQALTGLPFGRIMVFPYGISPEPTLTTLKRLNYLGTVNAQDAPLGAPLPAAWDYGMLPAILDYSAFPVIERNIYVGDYGNNSIDWYVQAAMFDLFIDKPALFWSHPVSGQLFSTGIDQFSPIADAVNDLHGEAEWRSLDDILEHMSLTKRNDDGSVSIMMFTNRLVFTNPFSHVQHFYIQKQESDAVPIQSVSVNGRALTYQFADGALTFDVQLQPHAALDVTVLYGAA